MLLLALAGLARADVTDLTGGVLAVHRVPELSYSTDPPAGTWCASYAAYAVNGCDDLITDVEVQGAAPVVWFVLAAWAEPKEWCALRFGLGTYDDRMFGIDDHGPCFPAGGLEDPTAGWPGPNSGTAIAIMGTPWSGSWTPVYFFRGYAYASYGPGRISLAEHPETGMVELTNCQMPAEIWPAVELGALGINRTGIAACPILPWTWGACCVYGDCLILYQQDCRHLGGDWFSGHDCLTEDPCWTTPVSPTSWGRLKAIYR
jgi:hypothetical protein